MKKIVGILLVIFGLALNVQAQVITTAERQDFALGTVAFGSVTAAYTTFLANATGIQIKDLDVLNLTDAPITCSYNASTDHVVVPAYSSYTPKLPELNMHQASALSCKRTSAAPTVGSVYVTAGY